MSTHNMFSLRNTRDRHFSDEKSALSVAMNIFRSYYHLMWLFGDD